MRENQKIYQNQMFIRKNMLNLVQNPQFVGIVRKKGHTRNSCKVKRKINVVPISSDKKQRYLDLLSDNDNSELELSKLEESEPLSE